MDEDKRRLRDAAMVSRLFEQCFGCGTEEVQVTASLEGLGVVLMCRECFAEILPDAVAELRQVEADCPICRADRQ